MPARKCNRKDMPMKSKRGKIIFTGVIILAIVIAAFVYKQPVEIEDMYKNWDFDECTSIDFYAKYGTDGKYYNSGDFGVSGFTLEKGDEGFDEIIALFDGREFTRSFKRAKANVGGTAFAYVDFWWDIEFFADGKLLSVDNFVGKKVVASLRDKDDVDSYRIAIDRDDPWLREVFDTAVKYAQADEQKPAV